MNATSRASMSQPFWLAPEKPTQKAILLIHGFLASPYIMKNLGEALVKAGYLVYAILLPGHGSRFEDLQNVRMEDYLKAAHEGYQALSNKPGIEDITILGFSIGATLALILSMELKLKQCIALAPAFKISPAAQLLPLICTLKLDKILPDLRCTQSEPINLGSYSRFPMQSVVEVQKIIDLYQKKRKAQKMLPQLYCAASTEDATVQFKSITENLADCPKGSCLRVYTHQTGDLNLPRKIHSTRIQMQSFPGIDAMSHVGMPVSEHDAYFGKNGIYYGNLPENIRFGEPHFWDFGKPIKRLTYNPEFEALAADVIAWLI